MILVLLFPSVGICALSSRVAIASDWFIDLQFFFGVMLSGYFEMDNSIVAMEESHERNDSPVSASKSVGSFVQINSIAIDLSCAMEETESQLHEHFSIR